MAYSNRFCSMFNDNFKILTWVLILFIAITPNFIFIHAANAGAAEAWTIEEVVYNDIGKNLTYTASKTGVAANDYIYKAKVPVTAAATGSTVASMIRMGLAGAAIYGIVEGVGWIIENGVVKKIDPNAPSPDNSSFPYLWIASSHIDYVIYSAPTMEAFATVIRIPYENLSNRPYEKSEIIYDSPTKAKVKLTSAQHGYTAYIGADYKSNPNYDPSLQPSYIPVSDSELGEEVNKSPHAPELLPDIYNPNNPAGGAAPQKTADALDSANPEPRTAPKSDTIKKPNKDTNGDGEPDVYDPTEPDAGESTVWPSACEWIPVVCEWYVEYKQDVKKAEAHAQETKDFWQTVKDWFNWTKELPDEDSGEVTIHEDTNIIFDDSQRVNFSSSCPSPEQFSVSFFGASQNLEFSYQPLCNFMSMIKPFVVAGSYLIGAYIVMGLSRGNGD